MLSTQVARTQPDVVTPATTSVSPPALVSEADKLVPKKALGYCLVTTVFVVVWLEAFGEGLASPRPRRSRASGGALRKKPVGAALPVAHFGQDHRNAHSRADLAQAQGGLSSELDTLAAEQRPTPDRSRPARNRRGSAPACGPGLRGVIAGAGVVGVERLSASPASVSYSAAARYGSSEARLSRRLEAGLGRQRPRSSAIDLKPRSNKPRSARATPPRRGAAARSPPCRRGRRRSAPRHSGARRRRVTSPRATSAATFSGWRFSGSPQPPPPQVLKCRTSPGSTWMRSHLEGCSPSRRSCARASWLTAAPARRR